MGILVSHLLDHIKLLDGVSDGDLRSCLFEVVANAGWIRTFDVRRPKEASTLACSQSRDIDMSRCRIATVCESWLVERDGLDLVAVPVASDDRHIDVSIDERMSGQKTLSMLARIWTAPARCQVGSSATGAHAWLPQHRRRVDHRLDAGHGDEGETQRENPSHNSYSCLERELRASSGAGDSVRKPALLGFVP